MFKPKLAVALRKAGIEDELQSADEVAFANLVLTDNDDAIARLDVNFREVCEIAYFIREIRMSVRHLFTQPHRLLD